MPLIDGVKSFVASETPDFREEKVVVLTEQDLRCLCRDYDLPMFVMENITFKDRLIEKKTDLNLLFTRFSGIWIMAYEDMKGGEKDGKKTPGTPQ